ncbi:hypothetical protein F4809DRAFT_658419 [Biscogniauxia mediterranea]|nr:hypothetical protein F4809DRAFT_658419 [Biscogniauxia mediterranea]
MESDQVSDQYFASDGRLASFQVAQPIARRASNVKGGKGPKSLAWPHDHLDPELLVRAGFFFQPTDESPDNTVCFLCLRNIGGWEETDNPFEEHLRLSPHCGWAIVAGIEVGLGDYGLDDPTSAQMIEARKATFGGRWPHEGKRGWKCKTKQLVDAGWKYTPSLESNDMATCTYCQLALDGWEPKDNPMDEHYRRSPDCQFFNLINHYKSVPGKKKGRGKGVRTSKASRISGQSIATAASDMTSMLDQPADFEDSVLTTTSVMTQGGTKRGRAKKATTAKGKKTRTRKDEAVEVLEDPPEVQEDIPAPAPPKPTRGRKRASDSIEDSVLTATEAPAPKKRAGRGRRSNTVESSIIEPQPTESAPLPKGRGKGKGKATASNNRVFSAASTVSTTSALTEDEHMLDDDELDRQLQADMDRPLSDDESIVADLDHGRTSDPNRSKSKDTSARMSNSIKREEPSSDHAMIDNAAVDDELKTLQGEMETEPIEQLQIPKKGRKAGTRKVSKQTKKAKEKAPVEPMPEPEPEQGLEADAYDELADGHDISINSDGTVVRNSLSSTTSAPKKRGRPSKKAMAAKMSLTHAETVQAETIANTSKVDRIDFADRAPEPEASIEKDFEPEARESSPPPDDKFSPMPPESDELGPPSTPKAVPSPAPAARQATLSPSQSPQSSDAENRPPSSRPSNMTNNSSGSSSRPRPAALEATTPPPVAHSSPSRRNNVFAGLESSQPWSAVDIDTLFEDLDRENAAGGSGSTMGPQFLREGPELTSPEKRMTVEEWVYHNAEQAEKMLKHECEAMVTAFEREGTRAMRALEGLVIE